MAQVRPSEMWPGSQDLQAGHVAVEPIGLQSVREEVQGPITEGQREGLMPRSLSLEGLNMLKTKLESMNSI